MNDNGQLRRILIATLMSFIFFVAYDYFILQPQIKASENNLTKEKTVNSNLSTSTKNNKVHEKAVLQKTKIIANIEAKNYTIKIDSLGRISSFVLKQAKFNTENGKHLELISDKLPKPLEIRFENKEINKLAFSTDYIADKKRLMIDNKPKTITLTQKLKNETVTKKITFYPDGHYDVKIILSNPVIYYISQGYRPDVAIDQLTIHGLIIKKSDGVLEIIEDGDAKNESFENAIFSASFDRYYTTLLFSKKPFSVIVTPDKDKNPISFIKLDSNSKFIGYIGPKYVDTLKAIDKELIDVVQYGVGTFFARNLF
ncbi:MAG TPA: membrane protein insertase YidC, partial [Nautiliaceae bacterium]|nr:membrane protein insertase YidC [Nautiliaceae bacterium]